MSDLMKVGPDFGGSGTFKPFTAGFSGAQRVSDAHARYMDAVLGNRVFFLSAAAAAPTAYVGAAGGSPLIAIHNPTNSGKYLVAWYAALAQRAAATAAGVTGLAIWAGLSVLPTGTLTPPTGALSLTTGGSVAKGFVNTALTGSTALALALPLATRSVGAAAAEGALPGLYEIAGLVVVAPGNQAALGLTVVPTALTADVALFWEEVPYLV
jgi:hypothetical protein